jgi:8-oxo-dGTP pyrophosphatase MutT (NUDIX family)
MSVTAWTVLDSRVTFADPRLRVRSDRCRTADGDVIGPNHVIECPDWVAIVALTRGGERLLTRRAYRHGVGAVLTGLPGGLVDPGDGTSGLDEAEAAAGRERQRRRRLAGLADLSNPLKKRDDGASGPAASELAARRALLEGAGYAGGRWTCLLRTHPDPSNQTNTAFCFLAANVDRAGDALLHLVRGDQELAEQDLIEVLEHLRQGNVIMHSVHVAALWSAATHIASDRSGQFGALPIRLRRFLVGETDVFGSDPAIPAAFPSSAVGRRPYSRHG